MKVQQAIERKLTQTFRPHYLEVVNESANHRVPPGSESHFKVVLVCAGFQGKTTLARHRLVNAELAEELAGPVHALSLRLYAPAQWEAMGQADPGQSPPCKSQQVARGM